APFWDHLEADPQRRKDISVIIRFINRIELTIVKLASHWDLYDSLAMLPIIFPQAMVKVNLLGCSLCGITGNSKLDRRKLCVKRWKLTEELRDALARGGLDVSHLKASFF